MSLVRSEHVTVPFFMNKRVDAILHSYGSNPGPFVNRCF